MAKKKVKKNSKGSKKVQKSTKKSVEPRAKKKTEKKIDKKPEITKKKSGKIQLSDKINLEPKKEHKIRHVFERKYGAYLGKAKKPILNVFKVFVALTLLGFFGFVGIYLMFGLNLPSVNDLRSNDFAETTIIYDREGNVLYSVFAEENRKQVPLSYISDHAINATLSMEDKNFYHHFGFDVIGIIRAQLKNLEEEEIKQGASTITQQLAKNVFLSPEKTYERKIKELILAMQIEWNFSKDEILELYLNKIPYGSNAYGIEAAAKTFFNKTSDQLTLAESAVLASLPKAPSYYSPYGQNKAELMGVCLKEEGTCDSPSDNMYAKGRKDLVLDRMVEDKYITREEADQAWADAFDLKFRDPVHKIEAPHFVFYVLELLEEKYGKDLVARGGFEVVTSLDPKMQSIAEEVLAERDEYNQRTFHANNGAIVAIDPKTGQILAMVGSQNYWRSEIDGQVNVATSLRQPGSSFKPLVYAAAIQNAGIGSGTFISDEKTAFTRNYIPNNSDNTFKGDMIVRHALAWSRNIPAIKAFYIAGEEEKLLDFLDQVGIHSLRKFKNDFNKDAEERGWTFHYGPAMAIGSGELTLLELVGGYSVFANGGKRMPVNPIIEIRDRDGEIIEKFDPESGIDAVDPQVAYIINNILSDVYARPGGSWRAGLTIPGHTVAAKTGTSNKKVGRTNYPNNLLTIGYTPSIAVGAWVGNSDGSHLYWNSWGLTGAAPIWKAFMTRALEGKEDEPFAEPEGLIWRGREVYPSWFEWRNHDAQFKKVDDDEEEDEEEIIKPEESDFVQSRDRDPATGEVIKNEPVDIPEIPDKIEDNFGGDDNDINSIPYGF